MKRTDWAYIAGIIDGEGCICIAPTGQILKDGKKQYCLALSVSSTDEWLCQFLKMAFGGSIYKYHKQKEHHSDAWQWGLKSRQAAEALKVIIPYLRIKRPQAELAVKYQETKHRYYRHSSYSETDRVLEEANYILMHNLKKKEATNGV